MARTITVKFVADTKDFDAAAEGVKRKVQSALSPATASVSSFRSALSASTVALGALAAAGVAAFKQIGERALQAAINMDRTLNTLKALTGSAQAAEQRFAALIALAQKTPGLTTSLAATLDTSLRILNVTEKTIDRLLPTIGKLNAIAPLGDPRQFVNNLQQLVTQGFERQDLKELVGNSPFAGEIIKSLFNVDSPTNAKAIREAAAKLGIKTFEDFAIAFVKAAESDTRLQAVTESLGTKFEKLQDRLDVALAGLGQELAKTLLPLFEDLVKAAENYGAVVAEIFKDNRSDIIATVRSIGDLIGRLGDLTNAVFSLASSAKSGLSGLKQEFEDLASIFAFLTDVSEGNIISRPRTLALTREQEAGRSSPFLESPVRQLPAAPQPLGRTGGGGGGLSGDVSGKISRAAKDRAKEIADLTKKIAEGRDEFMQGVVDDLSEVSKVINAANVEGVQRESALAERPAQLARQGAALAERIRQTELETLRLEQNTAKKAREELEKIQPILSNSERFMRGFAAATESVGDAFERFGANVSRAFTNVKDLFNGLKQAVLGFFNDLLGNALQNLVRQTLGGLFGGGASGGGGILGNLFRTPSFAGGGGISAPPSISLGPIGFGNGFGILGGGGSGVARSATSGAFTLDPLTARQFGLAKPSFLGGIGQSLAAAAPFLGLSLGGSLGGQSTAGNILGSAGGLLTGGFLGATLAPGLFSGAAAGLLTNPFTAIAGVGLLVGGALLGKAKQRRADEEASGQMLTQALQGINQLRDAIANDSIDGSQARAIFENQILAQFIQDINTLKTKSVRESRLTNQVADLRKVFNDVIPPQIAAQQERRSAAEAKSAADLARRQKAAFVDSRLIPEFATGGTAFGGLALLHPGEKILNAQQQAAVIRQSNPQVFERAGVPGPSSNRIFDVGGTMGAGSGGELVIENLNVSFLVGRDDATRIVVSGGSTPQGRKVTVNNIKVAQTNREL